MGLFQRFHSLIPIAAVLGCVAIGYFAIIVPVINPYLAVPPLVALMSVVMFHRPAVQDDDLVTLDDRLLTLYDKVKSWCEKQGTWWMDDIDGDDRCDVCGSKDCAGRF